MDNVIKPNIDSWITEVKDSHVVEEVGLAAMAEYMTGHSLPKSHHDMEEACLHDSLFDLEATKYLLDRQVDEVELEIFLVKKRIQRWED